MRGLPGLAAPFFGELGILKKYICFNKIPNLGYRQIGDKLVFL